MSEAKPECPNFGKMPSYERRGIACALCSSRVFANCALESMKEHFARKGVVMEKVKS